MKVVAGISAHWHVGRSTRALLQTFAIILLATSCTFAAKPELYDFRGQVALGGRTLAAESRLTLALFGVDVNFTDRTQADTRGDFQFRGVPSGSYVLSIYIPDDGEILRTVDITRSFADGSGRVQRKFVFSEEELRSEIRDLPQSMISARLLSVPVKAKGEYYESESCLRRDDVAGAIRHLERAVRLAPQFLEAVNHLGTVYFREHQYSMAEKYFRQALNQDPRAYEPLVNLGGVLLAENRFREALAVNLHAQSDGPNDALANAQLGLNYFALNDLDNALVYLSKAERLDPAHSSNPQIILAEIYMRRSDPEKAAKQLDDFLRLHPDSPLAERVRLAVRRVQREPSGPTVSQERRPF
jgi:tetratricopeptide (TPR) repeat protein